MSVKIITLGLVGRQGAGKDFTFLQLSSPEFIAKYHQEIGEHLTVKLVRMAGDIKTASARVFHSVSGDNYADFEAKHKEEMVEMPAHQFLSDCVDVIFDLYSRYKRLDSNINGFDVVMAKMLEVFSPLMIDNHTIKISPRIFQQLLGTDIFRETVSFTFWVDLVRKEIADLHKSHVKQYQRTDDVHTQLLICSDVRFDNEAALFRNHGYVYRHNKPKVDVHVSESFCENVHADFLTQDGLHTDEIYSNGTGSKVSPCYAFNVINNSQNIDSEQEMKSYQDQLQTMLCKLNPSFFIR